MVGQGRAPDETRASLTILGSGTLVPDQGRACAAHLIQTERARVLLDCGPGTLHGMDRHGVAWQRLTHVVISHFHNDHVADLSGLMLALRLAVEPPRQDPLVLIGPPGFLSFLNRLTAALGDSLLEPGFPVSIEELHPGVVFRDDASGFSLQCVSTPHTEESVAYRWEGEEGAVAYTGDTGPSHAMAEFMTGAQVLIAECTLSDPPDMDTHLSPAGLAEILRVAEPSVAVITHVYPPQTPAQAAARVAAAGYGGRVLPGYDGLRVPFGP